MSRFVTFEGTEGSGKSTQARLLAEALRARRHDVVLTREPGGTALGEALRALLLEHAVPICPEAEAYLMTAARAQHVREVIRPALARGAIVVCDRFADSTFAYQGAGRGLPLERLREMQALAVADAQPDLTVLVDVPVAVGLARRRREGDANRIDREDLAFHARVAEWYRQEARRHPDRWIVVDGARPIEAVHADVLRAVLARLAGLGVAAQG